MMRVERSASTGWLGRWWWTMDRVMLIAIVMIVVIGVVLVSAASPSVAERLGLSSFHFVKRQIVFLIMGLSLLFVFSTMSAQMIRMISVLAFAGCTVLLVAVLVIAPEYKGATRWIQIPGLGTLQPSEFIKPFFAILSAWFLTRKHRDNFPGFKVATGLYGMICVLLILQPDFGMTLAVSAIWGVQIFLAGLPMGWIILAVMGGIGGSVAAYFLLPHVAKRINTFLDPSTADNYQVGKSLEAFMNGGLMGRGPGQGVVKERIPDAHTDFIFAVAGEELGVVVCVLMVMLFAFVVARGFTRVMQENDIFVIYASAGLLTQFAVMAIVNMGVATNILPNTGMTLPFISYGGSSTLAISIAMGMILALTRKQYGARIVRKAK